MEARATDIPHVLQRLNTSLASTVALLERASARISLCFASRLRIAMYPMLDNFSSQQLAVMASSCFFLAAPVIFVTKPFAIAQEEYSSFLTSISLGSGL